jgi:hypothetical protein
VSEQPPANSLVISDDDLLVFIDETGHEALPPAAPIFGIGGIIVYGADYTTCVEHPWSVIRQAIGLSATQPLHAASDFERYKQHLPAIEKFFLEGVFVRHASIVTPETTSNFDAFITSSCAGLARNVGRTLARVCKNAPVNRLVYVVEHSQRLHSKYQSLIGPTGPTLIASDGSRRVFTQQWAAIRKTSCSAGLEVSDFVMHAAQGHVRSLRQNPDAPCRKDFEVVFRRVSPDHVEYMEINTAEATPSDGPPGAFRIGLQ